MSNLTGLFDSINEEVEDIAAQVGQTPAGWNGSIYSMVHTLSENVIVPIAGLILAFVMTLEFIQMIIERNNFHDFDLSNIYKWMFKTACTVLIVTNTWNIVMAVFDVSQNIVNDASGIIVGSTTLDFDMLIPDLQTRLEALELGELLGLWIQSFLVGFYHSVSCLYVCSERSIILCQQIQAILIHADSFRFGMFRQRFVQGFRNPQFELPGIFILGYRHGNVDSVFQCGSQPFSLAVFGIANCFFQ